MLAYNPEADVGLVQKAYVLSAKYHAGSLRKSGLPYLSHPLEVAGILTELKLPESSVAVGLLHDVIEDTQLTIEELEAEFGKDIARMVDGVTKMGRITADTSRVEAQADYLRKMILAMAQDVKVILIKLADRLHNMRTLEYLEEPKRRAIAKETMDIYAPIAGRLGIHWIRAQLEDLSFQHLQPEAYAKLAQKVAKTKQERQKYVERVQQILTDRLRESGIETLVTGRFKHIYSIQRKMERQKITFDEIHDLIAFRILVKTINECYIALRIIHSFSTPIPGRIKDYVALPKPNMYKSLHTSVIGEDGERMEIQIRTHDMHAIAQYGIAAHWRYKELGAVDPKDPSAEEKTLEFLRNLLQNLEEFHEELKDPYRFLESIKSEVVPNEIIVFTPKGDLVELPVGATPIDMAYAIHSDLGNSCGGSKINGRIAPLSRELKSGDKVEIITSSSVEPSKAWLEIVETPRARAKITHWITTKEAERAREIGRQELEAELLKYGRALGQIIESGELNSVLQRYNFSSHDRLFEAVGFKKFPARKVIGKLVPAEEMRWESSRAGKPKSGKKSPKKSGAKRTRADAAREKPAFRAHDESSDEIERPMVSITSLADPSLTFGKCCDPLVEDDVVALRRDDQTVEIHRADCPRVMEAHSDRILRANWKGHVRGESEATIEVVSQDVKGMLVKITSVISEANLDIMRALAHTTDDRKAIHSFRISIKNLSQLNRIINAIEKLDGVISVKRGGPYAGQNDGGSLD
jgi:GTP pyrophosphokinase